MMEKNKPYQSYKDSGVYFLGEIPKDWTVKRIKYLFKEINNRNTNDSLDLLSVSQYTGITIKKDSLNEGDILTNAKTLDGYKKVEKGDLVSNIMLAWNGSLGVSDYEGITSPAYGIYRLIKEYSPKYFHYLYRTALYKSEFKRNSTGVIDSRLRLYTDSFFKIYSLVPPKDDQNKIVNFLDHKTTQIDNFIQTKEKTIALLQERKAAIINQAVTKGLDPIVPMKDSGIEWLGDIPEHWDNISKMKFISSLKGRQGWQGLKAEEYTDEGPHVLSSAHFNNYQIDWEKCPRVSMERYLMDENIQLKIGDILLMKDGANMGKLAMVDNLPGPACLNSHLLLFRSFEVDGDPIYFPKFMFYYMMCKKFQDYIKVNGTGATFLGISQESIGNYPICLPSFIEQRLIVKFIEKELKPINQVIDQNEKEIGLIKEYRESLISAAVTGKIDVRDYQIMEKYKSKVFTEQ